MFYPIQKLTHQIAFTTKILQNPRETDAMASEHHTYVVNLNISLYELIYIYTVSKQSCMIKRTCSYHDVCFGMDGVLLQSC